MTKLIIKKGGAEAGFVAQLLFYPVTEQLFVFNESQVRCSRFRLLPPGRRVRTILRGYKPAVRCVPAVKKKCRKVLTYVVINTIYIL